MRITQLPKKKINELRRKFKKEKLGRQKTRYQAIFLLANGYKRKEVSTITGISADRIRQLVTMYHRDGLSGLRFKPAPGNHLLLTQQQKKSIKNIVVTKTPKDAGFVGNFWNIALIKQLVEKEFRLTYQSNESYRRLFHFCGLTFHKSAKVKNRTNKYVLS